MKVVLLPNFISKSYNGTIYFRNTEIKIFKQLQELGNEVFIFGNLCSKKNKLLNSAFYNSTNLNFVCALKKWKLTNRIFNIFIFLYKFIKLTHNKDLIYIYLPYTYALLLFPVLIFKRNYALYIRGNINNSNFFILTIYKYLIRNSRFNICTGTHLTNFCKNYNKHTFEVVPMFSIPLKKNNTTLVDHKQINLLYLSGISKAKGVFDFLIIANKILTDIPNVKITIAGAGPEEEMDIFYNLYEKIIDKERCKYLGRIEDKNEIIKLLQENNIFIHTSYSEGFPRAIIEAMANGLIVISSKIDAVMNFLVNRENSLLFEPGNLDQLYYCVKEISDDESIFQNLRTNSTISVNIKLQYYKEEISHMNQILKYFELTKKHE